MGETKMRFLNAIVLKRNSENNLAIFDSPKYIL